MSGEAPAVLASLRSKIDDVDEAMSWLFRRRRELVEAVSLVKLLAQLPAQDPEREAQLVKRFFPVPGPEQEAYREVIRVFREFSRRRIEGERPTPVPSPFSSGDPFDALERLDRG